MNSVMTFTALLAVYGINNIGLSHMKASRCTRYLTSLHLRLGSILFITISRCIFPDLTCGRKHQFDGYFYERRKFNATKKKFFRHYILW